MSKSCKYDYSELSLALLWLNVNDSSSAIDQVLDCNNRRETTVIKVSSLVSSPVMGFTSFTVQFGPHILAVSKVYCIGSYHFYGHSRAEPHDGGLCSRYNAYEVSADGVLWECLIKNDMLQLSFTFSRFKLAC
nr:hypothetical protein CFP56_13465 [Quercus suber]